ncbi:hypothetical protein HRE53_13100 [Acaryochloris sp. 'Moss Beach']|uniref:hypothetical protein n=1 Tax=Acaryochloris sp. 'Moss Beach' TaxID=2740837 RepID=UPI001F273754|nr:hypothetical protein [Acaryochloris sp. 'Moss Beach']UJB67637.1 hypothetical protein HRE53_13100 [Acaryochloris sp. 'Moss Beach']
MNITRHQLIGLGATRYLTILLTRELQPVGKEKCSYLYQMVDVIKSIQTKQKQPRTRKKTKATLAKLLQSLQTFSLNVVSIPFGTSKTSTSKAVKHLLKSATNSKTTQHKLKAAELKGKRLSHVQ